MTAPAEANLPPPSAPESKGLEEAAERWAFDHGIPHGKRDKPAWQYSIIDFTAGAKWGLSQGREAGHAEASKEVEAIAAEAYDIKHDQIETRKERDAALKEVEELKAEIARLLKGEHWTQKELDQSKETVKCLMKSYFDTVERLSLSEAEVGRLKVQLARVRHINAKFKLYGTDGCKSCETGRVTLFRANDECISCNPESYELVTTEEALAAPAGEEEGNE